MQLSPYDYWTDEQLNFLNVFLKMRGNLKNVGEALGCSYPMVKNILMSRWQLWDL